MRSHRNRKGRESPLKMLVPWNSAMDLGSQSPRSLQLTVNAVKVEPAVSAVLPVCVAAQESVVQACIPALSFADEGTREDVAMSTGIFSIGVQEASKFCFLVSILLLLYIY